MSRFQFHSILHLAENESGHLFSYHKEVEKAVLLLGGAFFGYLPRNSTIVESQWRRWFRLDFNKKRKFGFLKDAIALFKKAEGHKRVFFLDCFSRNDFKWLALASLLFARNSDRFFILYRDDIETRKIKDQKSFLFWNRLLKWKLKENLLALTDTLSLQTLYEGLLGKKVSVLPIPLEIERKPVAKSEKILFSWVGPPRQEKGLSHIKHLLKLQDSATDKIVLTLSEEAPFIPSNGLTLARQKKILPLNEYLDLLSHSDCILLPYDPAFYKRRSSGIFVEAILLGKIPLVRSGTWLESELLRYGLPELVVNWESPHFFSEALLLISNSLIKEKLEVMQNEYRKFHSSKGFQEALRAIL